MADLSDYLYGNGGQDTDSLDDEFERRLLTMITSMPAHLQNQVLILSAYRSVEHQQRLWNDAVARYGSEAAARRWVAPPGRSNHNHGVAVDLHYVSSAAKRWVHDNAGRFGMRFPMDHEPWHIEPVGVREGSYTPSGHGHDDEPWHVSADAYTDGQGLPDPDVVNGDPMAQFERIVDLLQRPGGASSIPLAQLGEAADVNTGKTQELIDG